jgi:predicted MFS family arabinose efflux permease
MFHTLHAGGDFHEGLGLFGPAADTSFRVKRVLRLGAYRRLLAAYTLNELVWGIGSLALAVLVYNRTGSALASAGYFLCAMFGPALVSPALVARLDQRSSRPVLVGLYALEAVLFGVLAWVAGRFALVPILLLSLLDGIVAVTARALARTATVSITSAAGLLREANAVTNASFSVCYMVGPALGGVAVALGSPSAALWITSGVFVLIALTLGTARGLPSAVPQQAPTTGRLRAAFRYARVTPLVRALLELQATSMLFVSIPIPVEVVLAGHTLHGGAGGYGGMLSAWGAGAVLGSVIYARWRKLPNRLLIALGATCMGAGFVVMAAAPVLAVAIAGAAIAGVGNGVMFVAGRTALQEAVDGPWMALMMSLNESIIQGVPGAGILIGGALAAASGPRAALALGGVGALATGGAVWLILRRAAATRTGSPAAAAAPAETRAADVEPEPVIG